METESEALERTYEDARAHIERTWDALTFEAPVTHGITIGLPCPFVAPCADVAFAGQQFYWDSYFTIIGLVVSGRVSLARGMVDNLLHLFRIFGIVPMRNRIYNTGTSQPPFLTSMIREVYQATGDTDWLREAVAVAKEELDGYWMESLRPERHLVHRGLSRYCDHSVTHTMAEHESGWDMTSRFGDICLDYLPVDLNSLLYRYERDLAGFMDILGDPRAAEEYATRAERRKKAMNELFWDEERGAFFDYDYKRGKRSTFLSLATVYPLWAGWADERQAAHVRDALSQLEFAGGLATTQPDDLAVEQRQWDFPNGWAPHHYLAVQGLFRYGLDADAERIARKWLALNALVFHKTGAFWEKYDVVRRDVGVTARYPTQRGFGWTNGVFVRLSHDLAQRP